MSPKTDEAGDVYQLENWICTNETEQLEYYFKFCYIAINRAKELLQGTSLKISEISEMVGYENPSYFNYTFKKNTGKTPGEYRKN